MSLTLEEVIRIIDLPGSKGACWFQEYHGKDGPPETLLSKSDVLELLRQVEQLKS